MLDRVLLYVTNRFPRIFLRLGDAAEKTVGKAEYLYFAVGAGRKLSDKSIGQTDQQVIGLKMTIGIAQFHRNFSFPAIKHQKYLQFDILVFLKYIFQPFGQEDIVVHVALRVTMCLKHVHVNVFDNFFHVIFLQRCGFPRKAWCSIFFQICLIFYILPDVVETRENKILLCENPLCAFSTGLLLLREQKKETNMTEKIGNLGAWLMVLGCAIGITSCQTETKETTGKGYQLMTIQADTDKEITTSYSASIEGMQDIDIYPQVSGYIEKLNVSEGDVVRKGEVLFVIDQVPYKAALETAVANVEVAKASLATAELTYKSTKELYAKKVVSSFNLQTTENEFLTAKAQLAQAKAQEVNARNNLSYTEVKSPSEGVVGMLPYRVGTLVSSNMAQPLTTVSDNAQMYVYFSMTENQFLSLARQYGTTEKAIQNMPEIQLQLNDGSMYEEKGKIESISGVIDKETGTVGVRAVFPNASRLLHSGASGNVLIPSIYKKCIVIPQGATIQLQDKILAYKVVDGKAVSTLIKVAPVNDGKEYIVTDGLKAGDEIVADGAGMLREGTQVK